MDQLVPVEVVRKEFFVKVDIQRGMGLGCGPRYVLARAYHKSCPEVKLGWAESTFSILLSLSSKKHPFVMYIYHEDKSFDEGIEKLTEEKVLARWEELKEGLVKEALELANSNLTKLRS